MQDLALGTALHWLTLEGPNMDSDHGATFATVFQSNHTIKTLTWGRGLSGAGAVTFVKASFFESNFLRLKRED